MEDIGEVKQKNSSRKKIMRIRMGKGQVLVFDTYVGKRLEELRVKLGYYPSLKEVADSCTPPSRSDFIDRALRRLAAAGKLSSEARLVYNSKKQKGDSHEKTNKSCKSKK